VVTYSAEILYLWSLWDLSSELWRPVTKLF